VDSEQVSHSTSSASTGGEDGDLYSKHDPDTEPVGGRFHRKFCKTIDTEPFTGPVGDALKVPERSRTQDVVSKLNPPANAPVKNYALIVLNQLFLSLSSIYLFFLRHMSLQICS
jgi:hypothetical protein